MGAISLLNQLYKEKTQEYGGEIKARAESIAKKNEKRMYKETPLKDIEREKKKLEKKIESIKTKYETSEYTVKAQLQQAITNKKVEIEAKLVSATKQEATKLILEFQKWWPTL